MADQKQRAAASSRSLPTAALDWSTLEPNVKQQLIKRTVNVVIDRHDDLKQQPPSLPPGLYLPPTPPKLVAARAPRNVVKTIERNAKGEDQPRATHTFLGMFLVAKAKVCYPCLALEREGGG